MRVIVFGAGYVGLVTGTCLAEMGHEVSIVDTDKSRVEKLKSGVVPIYEPGLADLVRRGAKSAKLRFATQMESSPVDFYFIAVGTPPNEDGSADTRAVFQVASTIAESAKHPAVVVVKSTVPVGTCDRVSEIVGVDFDVVSNPEFLKEGLAVTDFFRPDRIVMGSESPHAVAQLKLLYAPLFRSGDCPIVVCNRRSSELIKYASNTMLASRISFMNELSRVCRATGADIHSVRLGMGADTRIGKKFLYAGPGYGGSCFPKDVRALDRLGDELNLDLLMTKATHEANERQIGFLVDTVRSAVGGNLRGQIIALWGLAFKPETDDVREAPAVKLARALLAEGARVVGHDPEAGENFAAALGDHVNVQVVARDVEALAGAQVLVLMTEWRAYSCPDFASIKQHMKGDVVVDARNVWVPGDVEAAGLQYLSLGRSV